MRNIRFFNAVGLSFSPFSNVGNDNYFLCSTKKKQKNKMRCLRCWRHSQLHFVGRTAVVGVSSPEVAAGRSEGEQQMCLSAFAVRRLIGR